MLHILMALHKEPQTTTLKDTSPAPAQLPWLLHMEVLVQMTLQLLLIIEYILHYSFGKVISSSRMLEGLNYGYNKTIFKSFSHCSMRHLLWGLIQVVFGDKHWKATCEAGGWFLGSCSTLALGCTKAARGWEENLAGLCPLAAMCQKLFLSCQIRTGQAPDLRPVFEVLLQLQLATAYFALKNRIEVLSFATKDLSSPIF